MKSLHLCCDGNFIGNSISVFEHFFPGNNFWVILKSSKDERIINNDDANIIWFNFDERENYLKAISCLNTSERFENIVCHGLNSFFIEAVRLIRSNNSPKIYWLFWGYELYRPLGMSGKMKLSDETSFFNPLSYATPTKARLFYRTRLLNDISEEELLKEFVNYVDFFCFWFEGDFELLQRFYPCKASFKFFQYNANWLCDKKARSVSERYFNKEPRTIIINHQASNTGNHNTLLKKLKSLSGIESFDITAPLSYGSNSIRRYVCWKGKRLFGKKFHPVLNYMPLEHYNTMIGKMNVALFGQHRQEAAGNISFYLANGTKVFMREDNTLFHYFKKAGYIIFSFESDLNSIDDLVGLSTMEKRFNAELAAKRKCNYEDFMPIFFDDTL